MLEELTEEWFAPHVNTKFRVVADESHPPVELELTEVAGYGEKPGEQGGMVRFSLFFRGPADFFLPQRTYEFMHEHVENFLLFIVPIGRDEQGFRYEAVINRNIN